MTIYTKITGTWVDGKPVFTDYEGYDYYGPLGLVKGASAEQKQQAAAEAQLAQQQAQFMQAVQAQQAQEYAAQTAVLSSLQKAWAPILAAGPGQFGLTPEEATALRTQATEGTAGEYAKAAQAVGASQAASTPLGVYSGVNKQIQATIASQAAADQAAKQLGITQYGYDLGRSQFQNATNVMSGVAGLQNPLGWTGAATGAGSAASGATQGAFQDYTKIQEMENAASPWGVVGGILQGGLTAGLGAFTGGIGTAGAGKVMGCWVAAELFGGWHNPKTVLVREWLNTEFNKTFPGNIIVHAYRKTGKFLAEQIRKFPVLRSVFQPLFSVALDKALVWAESV